MIMIEKEGRGTALWWTHTYHIKRMAPHTPVTSIVEDAYVQPVTQQYESTTKLFKIFCNQSSHYDDFRYEWKPSRDYHKVDTFHGEQRWMWHQGRHWSVHEECIACIAVRQKSPLGL